MKLYMKGSYVHSSYFDSCWACIMTIDHDNAPGHPITSYRAEHLMRAVFPEAVTHTFADENNSLSQPLTFTDEQSIELMEQAPKRVRPVFEVDIGFNAANQYVVTNITRVITDLNSPELNPKLVKDKLSQSPLIMDESNMEPGAHASVSKWIGARNTLFWLRKLGREGFTLSDGTFKKEENFISALPDPAFGEVSRLLK